MGKQEKEKKQEEKGRGEQAGWGKLRRERGGDTIRKQGKGRGEGTRTKEDMRGGNKVKSNEEKRGNQERRQAGKTSEERKEARRGEYEGQGGEEVVILTI